MTQPIPEGIRHRVRWFTPPDRPVEGGTVFRRPDDDLDEPAAVTEEDAP